MCGFNEATKYDPGALTPNLPNTQRAGRYIGGRAGWANGPADVALAYGESTIADNFFAGSTTTLDIFNIGATYDFGVVKLFGEYSDNKLKVDQSNPTLAGVFGISAPSAKGWLLGATVPVGVGLIRASYSAVHYSNRTLQNQIFGAPDSKADKWALGYVHNLSKRTALYATVGYVRNKNGADLTMGGPDYVRATNPALAGTNAVLTPKSSVGYDFGIRHAF